MNFAKIVLLVCCILWAHSKSWSQLHLTFDPNFFVVKKGYFDSVIVIDRRSDTLAPLGHIKINFQKGYEKLLPKTSLANDLYNIHHLQITKGSNKTLAIVIYEFKLEEKISDVDAEIAGFRFLADYFLSNPDGTFSLYQMADLDTFVRAYDVTNKLIVTAQKTLNAYLNNVTKQSLASQHKFTIPELHTRNPTDVKHFLPYSKQVIQDGVYADWNSFLYGRKDENLVAKFNYDGIDLYRKKKKGEQYISNPGSTTIIVKNGQYFLKNKGDILEFWKDSVGFWTTKKIRMAEPLNLHPHQITSEQIVLTAMAGIFSTLLLPMGSSFFFWHNPAHSKGSLKLYYCVINHRNGALVPIKPIEKKPRKEAIYRRKNEDVSKEH